MNISYCNYLVYVYFRNLSEERRLHLCTKSFILYKNASLAQRLEHRICNARVVGSIPTGGLCFIIVFTTLQLHLLLCYFFGHYFCCLGRLMDGLQPSKLFCVGSIPIRDVELRASSVCHACVARHT